MQTSDVEYQADDRRMVGYLAVPDEDGPRPAVLICHEGPGLDDHAKNRARQLAELGYVAFALDYNGDGKPLPDMGATMKRLGPLMAEPLRIRQIGQAGLDILLGQPKTDANRVAAIGFCFGGTMALELARGGADLLGVVGFHSGLATARPEDAANIKGKVLVCIGAEDPIIPPKQRTDFEEEMRKGNVDWRMNLYGGAAHSFMNVQASQMAMPGIAYHAPTEARAWQAMRDFFAETIDA
jgi:dienelactone hydrolase